MGRTCGDPHETELTAACVLLNGSLLGAARIRSVAGCCAATSLPACDLHVPRFCCWFVITGENIVSTKLIQMGGYPANWELHGQGLQLEAAGRAKEIDWFTYNTGDLPNGAAPPWDVVYVRAKGRPSTPRWSAMPQQCPPRRACDTSRVAISCTGDKSMHSVPAIEYRMARTVVLTANALSSIGTGDFAGMRALEELDLSDNLITKLSASALKDCVSLVEFKISRNWLGDCHFAGEHGARCGQFYSAPIGRRFDFAWLSARTPHGAYAWRA